MNCEELLAFLQDFVGGELVIEQRQTVQVHIDGCERCGIIVHSYTHTVHVARVLPRCTLPPGMEARLRAAIEPELRKAKPGSSTEG